MPSALCGQPGRARTLRAHHDNRRIDRRRVQRRPQRRAVAAACGAAAGKPTWRRRVRAASKRDAVAQLRRERGSGSGHNLSAASVFILLSRKQNAPAGRAEQATVMTQQPGQMQKRPGCASQGAAQASASFVARSTRVHAQTQTRCESPCDGALQAQAKRGQPGPQICRKSARTTCTHGHGVWRARCGCDVGCAVWPGAGVLRAERAEAGDARAH